VTPAYPGGAGLIVYFNRMTLTRLAKMSIATAGGLTYIPAS